MIQAAVLCWLDLYTGNIQFLMSSLLDPTLHTCTHFCKTIYNSSRQIIGQNPHKGLDSRYNSRNILYWSVQVKIYIHGWNLVEQVSIKVCALRAFKIRFNILHCTLSPITKSNHWVKTWEWALGTVESGQKYIEIHTHIYTCLSDHISVVLMIESHPA